MVNLPPCSSPIIATQGYYGNKGSSSKRDESKDEFVVSDKLKVTSQTDKQSNQSASKKLLEICSKSAELQNANDKVRCLVEQGGDPDSKDIQGNTPLIYSLSNKRFNIANTLLELGASPSLAGNFGSFPLECVSKLRIPISQVIEQLRILLDFGADPNQSDDKGFTTLMYAVRDNKKGIVQFLLDNGAKISLKNKEGLTALDLAKQWKNLELATLLGDALQARTTLYFTGKSDFELMIQSLYEQRSIEDILEEELKQEEVATKLKKADI